MELSKQSLILEDRTILKMTNVKSVINFSDNIVNLKMDNCKMQVVGSNFKIQAFSESAGTLTLSGLITNIKYLGGNDKIKRLFK